MTKIAQGAVLTKPKRPYAVVRIQNLTLTKEDSELDMDRVRYMAHNFDDEMYDSPIGYWDGKTVRILDGNHRVRSAMMTGRTHILFKPVTEKEALQIEQTGRRIDMECYIPNKINVY